MANKFKTATVAVMAAIATMTANASSTNVATPDCDKKTDAAARVTRGSVLKYKITGDSTLNATITEYHIDQDGDNKVDVVRRRIVPHGQASAIRQSPFDIVEIHEVYDEKYNMWNITDEKRIGTRKLRWPLQKTR